MKKTAVIFLVLLLNISFLFSVEVDEGELKAETDKEIIFINYEGPHKVIDTMDQIKAIGTDLAEMTKNNADQQGKYQILHIVENIENKLDADIFIIKENAGVDHIKNLRHIIASYLSSMYAYEYDDAYILAEFITYYNAVYRSNVPYFAEKYNEKVVENIDEQNAGLSVLYTNWPGKTAIIIPLKEPGAEGDLSAIDPDVISDENVIEDLRSQDDKGLDSRKGMVEFKEKEIDENIQDIEAQQAELEKEKQALAEKEAALAGGGTAEEQAEIQKEKEALASQDEALKADKAKEEERLAMAQKERDKIVYDEKTKLKMEVSPEEEMKALANKMMPFFIFDEKGGKNNFYVPSVINKETGKVVKKGKLNTIRNSSFVKTSQGIIVVAGESSNNRAVKLLLLDNMTFEVLKENEESLYDNTPFIVENSKIYVIVDKNKKWYLARYNNDLVMEAISDTPVLADTAVYFEASQVYLQGEDKNIIILNNNDLKKQ